MPGSVDSVRLHLRFCMKRHYLAHEVSAWAHIDLDTR